MSGFFSPISKKQLLEDLKRTVDMELDVEINSPYHLAHRIQFDELIKEGFIISKIDDFGINIFVLKEKEK